MPGTNRFEHKVNLQQHFINQSIESREITRKVSKYVWKVGHFAVLKQFKWLSGQLSSQINVTATNYVLYLNKSSTTITCGMKVYIGMENHNVIVELDRGY